MLPVRRFCAWIADVWTTSFVTVMREFLVLIFGVWIPPITLLALFWHIDRFDDVFFDASCCLLIGLVWHHLVLFRRKDVSTKNITNYIDYVYLSYAALGLLGAADSTIRRYNDESSRAVRQAQEDLSDFRQKYRDAYSAACANEVNQEDCIIFNKLASLAKTGSLTLKSSPLLVNMKISVQEMIGEASKSVSVVNSIKSYEPNIFDEAYLASYLSYVPIGADTEDFYHRRQLGYLLIASAIALRLARVSVELGQWWAK